MKKRKEEDIAKKYIMPMSYYAEQQDKETKRFYKGCAIGLVISISFFVFLYWLASNC